MEQIWNSRSKVHEYGRLLGSVAVQSSGGGKGIKVVYAYLQDWSPNSRPDLPQRWACRDFRTIPALWSGDGEVLHTHFQNCSVPPSSQRLLLQANGGHLDGFQILQEYHRTMNGLKMIRKTSIYILHSLCKLRKINADAKVSSVHLLASEIYVSLRSETFISGIIFEAVNI